MQPIFLQGSQSSKEIGPSRRNIASCARATCCQSYTRFETEILCLHGVAEEHLTSPQWLFFFDTEHLVLLLCLVVIQQHVFKMFLLRLCSCGGMVTFKRWVNRAQLSSSSRSCSVRWRVPFGWRLEIRVGCLRIKIILLVLDLFENLVSSLLMIIFYFFPS